MRTLEESSFPKVLKAFKLHVILERNWHICKYIFKEIDTKMVFNHNIIYLKLIFELIFGNTNSGFDNSFMMIIM
jgi:hypothetical protein